VEDSVVKKLFILEGKMIKKLFLFYCLLLTANMLFAGGSSARTAERKIAKTDISIVPQRGESEIFFDLQSGSSVYIYLDGSFVAQCYSADEGWLEKVVVKNGRHTIEVFAITVRWQDPNYENTETDRKTFDCDVESESVTVEIGLNRVDNGSGGSDYKIEKLLYTDRRSLNQNMDNKPLAIDSKQRVPGTIAPFEEKSVITKSDVDAITDIFTTELLGSNSIRIITHAKITSKMEPFVNNTVQTMISRCMV
jgi:hypothetical protein